MNVPNTVTYEDEAFWILKRITRKGQELKMSKLGEYPAYIGFSLTCSHVYVVKSEFVN